MSKAPGYVVLAALFAAAWFITSEGDKKKAAEEAEVAECVRERLGIEYRSAEWYEINEAGRINYRRVCRGEAPINWRQ